MRNVIIAVMVSFLLISEAQAQKKVVPGYMGLKFSMQYQAGVNPQWLNLSESYMPYISHNLQLGYVVSRRHEVGLQYTRIDYKSAFFADQNIDYRNFTGNNVMAYVKFFRSRKGFIAPLGRYFLLGLCYQNTKDRYHVSYSVNGANYTNVMSHDVAFTMGVGRNIILFDRMLLTIEGDVNFPLSTIARAAKNSQFNTYQTNETYFKQTNALDAMLFNIIQIKIGIGALVF